MEYLGHRCKLHTQILSFAPAHRNQSSKSEDSENDSSDIEKDGETISNTTTPPGEEISDLESLDKELSEKITETNNPFSDSNRIDVSPTEIPSTLQQADNDSNTTNITERVNAYEPMTLSQRREAVKDKNDAPESEYHEGTRYTDRFLELLYDHWRIGYSPNEYRSLFLPRRTTWWDSEDKIKAHFRAPAVEWRKQDYTPITRSNLGNVWSYGDSD